MSINIVKHRLHVCLEGWSWTALGCAILRLGRGGEDELAGGVVGPRAVAPVGDPDHPDCGLLTTAELPPPVSCLLAPRKAGRDPDTTAARGQCQEVAAALLSANYAQPSIAMQRHKLSSHWV